MIPVDVYHIDEYRRVAALKCRQRKKQWLANLQHKVELYSQENDSLNAQLLGMRDEIIQLKSMLLAHKDCPLFQQQGVHVESFLNGMPPGGYDSGPPMPPGQNMYNMPIQQQPPPPQLMNGEMDRRFS